MAEKILHNTLRQIHDMKENTGALEFRELSVKANIVSLFDSAMSEQLYAEYEAFCASLEPEFGQRGGFSIDAFEDYTAGGDSLAYDPGLSTFKECAEDEMPYEDCNYRVEAQTYGKRWPCEVCEIQFWPIKSPERREEGITTWGEQYVSYESIFPMNRLSQD